MTVRDHVTAVIIVVSTCLLVGGVVLLVDWAIAEPVTPAEPVTYKVRTLDGREYTGLTVKSAYKSRPCRSYVDAEGRELVFCGTFTVEEER